MEIHSRFARKLGELQSLLSYLRIKPFEVSTASGRAKERYRRVALTSATTAAARVLQGALSLVSVPLALSHFGPERYGLWMTIGSFIAVASCLDQGLGYGLVQGIAEAEGKGDRALARQYVSTSFFSTLGLWSLGLAAFAAVYPFIPWPRVFNVQPGVAASEAGPAFAAFFCCFVANTVFGVVHKIQLGRQEGANNTLWQIVASVLAFGGLVTVIRVEAGLPWLVAVMTAAPPVAFLANGLVLFRARPWLLPRIREFRADLRRILFRSGGLVLGTQLAFALTLASDNLIITQTMGPEAVTDYAVPQRLFYVVQAFLALIPNALWPAYREALARGETAWVRRAFGKSIRYALGFSIAAALLLVVTGGALVRFWVGGRVDPSFWLLALLGTWMVLYATGAALTNLLNAYGAVRLQLLLIVAMGTAALLGKVIAVRWLGIAGAPLAMIISYAVLFVLPAAWHARRLLLKA